MVAEAKDTNANAEAVLACNQVSSKQGPVLYGYLKEGRSGSYYTVRPGEVKLGLRTSRLITVKSMKNKVARAKRVIQSHQVKAPKTELKGKKSEDSFDNNE